MLYHKDKNEIMDAMADALSEKSDINKFASEEEDDFDINEDDIDMSGGAVGVDINEKNALIAKVLETLKGASLENIKTWFEGLVSSEPSGELAFASKKDMCKITAQNLVRLSNSLDESGFTDVANVIDEAIQKLAIDTNKKCDCECHDCWKLMIDPSDKNYEHCHNTDEGCFPHPK